MLDRHEGAPCWTTRSLAFLAAAFVVIVLVRLHYAGMPGAVDLYFYSTVADKLLDGAALYVDVWDFKPPLIFVIYAAGQLVFGYSPNVFLALSIGTAILTAYGVYKIGALYSSTAAQWGVLLYALLVSSAGTAAPQPNAESFAQVFLTWAVFLVLRGERKRSHYLIEGSLFAAATLLKPFYVVFPAAFALFLLLRRPVTSGALHRVLSWLSVGLLIWIGHIVYFGVTGRGMLFVQSVFGYSRHYAGSVVANLMVGLLPSRIISAAAQDLILLLPVATIGLWTLWNRGESKVLAVWLLATWLAVVLPGRFYGHYYQLYYPPLALIAALGVASLRGRRGMVAGGFTAALLAFSQMPYVMTHGAELTRAVYGPSFGESRIGTFDAIYAADSILPDGATIYQVPFQDAPLVSERRTPAVVLFSTHLEPLATSGEVGGGNPLAEILRQRMAHVLSTTPPDAIIVQRFSTPTDLQSIPEWLMEWIEGNYHPVPDASNPWATVFFRRSGAADSAASRT